VILTLARQRCTWLSVAQLVRALMYNRSRTSTEYFTVETVTLLLSHRAISPNGVHPPGSGTTTLHLAASLDRCDIVNLLLEQPGIDDTLRDGRGQTCRDIAKNKDVIRAIEGSIEVCQNLV
jgi:ankyrin repeat protein